MTPPKLLSTNPIVASKSNGNSNDDMAGDGGNVGVRGFYESELPRNRLSMVSVLGLTFAIMAVPYGSSTTLAIALIDGGPVTVVWGWVLVSVVSLCIAASLAEICAAEPTAGGVYHWAYVLALPSLDRRQRRRQAQLTTTSRTTTAAVAAWVTGWLTLVGNWTVTLSIVFGGAQLLLSAVAVWKNRFTTLTPAAAVPSELWTPSAWLTVAVFWALMIVCLLVNVFGAGWLHFINKACIYWTGATVVVLMVTLLAMASKPGTGGGLRDAKWVFGHYDASMSGWPWSWAFFVGLLQGAYTLTGYGMVASMCDEVSAPAHQVPRAMVLSVAAAGLTGLLHLVPIMFVTPVDIRELLAASGGGQPIGRIFAVATGSATAAVTLLSLLLGIMLFAGVGALTAASRCTYAFARDGAIPGSRLWRKVDKRRGGVPVWALVLSTSVDCMLGLIYFGSTAAFNSFTGVATICLSTSYGMPILMSMLGGRRRVRENRRVPGLFSLGPMGFVVNAVVLAWIALSVVLFSMPVALPVEPTSMNYASVVFAGFAGISVMWYFVRGRKSFTGPPVLRRGGEQVERGDLKDKSEGSALELERSGSY